MVKSKPPMFGDIIGGEIESSKRCTLRYTDSIISIFVVVLQISTFLWIENFPRTCVFILDSGCWACFPEILSN